MYELHSYHLTSADATKYHDHQYVEAAKLIEQDSRVDNLGLCNFDTEHMDEIIDSGVKVVSNQVQVSYESLIRHTNKRMTGVAVLVNRSPTNVQDGGKLSETQRETPHLRVFGKLNLDPHYLPKPEHAIDLR